MARVKIDIPDKFLFTTYIPVRVTDLNYGEHVGNDTVLSLTHEARMQFLASYGFDEGKLVYDGVGLIMADAAIQYKGEIFYGVLLKVQITPVEYNNKGFELIYLFTDSKTDREYARVKTGMICFDYKNRKILPLPNEIKEIWKINP